MYMNKKIAIITDSTSMLTDKYLKENLNIRVIPLYILVNDESFKENIEITNEEFINKIKLKDCKLGTSQPSVTDFTDMYKELIKEGYDMGIALHISGGLSGTLQNSIMAANEVGFKLHYIDTKLGAYPLRKLIDSCLALIEDNRDISYILNNLQEQANLYKLFFIPLDLKQLKKSGRVNLSQLIITDLLNIKLILGFNDEGSFDVINKIRSEKKAFNLLIDKIKFGLTTKNINEVCIMHMDNLDLANKLKNIIEKEIEVSCIIEEFIPAVGVHAGLGTVAISF